MSRRIIVVSLLLMTSSTITLAKLPYKLDDIRTLAIGGDSIAQFRLGAAYDFAHFDIKQDYSEAARWYTKSAEQGYAEAQNSLSSLYQYGLGVDTDYSMAGYWYKRAADQGHIGATNSLGYLYEYGLGVEKNQIRAVSLYRLASDSGSLEAMNNLANCYGTGSGVEQSYFEAYKWFTIIQYWTVMVGHRDGDFLFKLKWRSRGAIDDLSKLITKKQIKEAEKWAQDWCAQYRKKLKMQSSEGNK